MKPKHAQPNDLSDPMVVKSITVRLSLMRDFADAARLAGFTFIQALRVAMADWLAQEQQRRVA